MGKGTYPSGPLTEEAMERVLREIQRAARAGVNGRWALIITCQGDNRIRVQEALPPHQLILNKSS